MKNKSIAFLGLMSALAAFLQISAGIFPVVGHLLSVFATLPIILAGRVCWRQGLLTYFAAAFIIFLIQPVEVPIFCFLTGLLGVSLAFGAKYSLPVRILIASTLLAVGMLVTSGLFAIPIFGGMIVKYSFEKKILFYLPFALIYSTIWVGSVQKYCRFRGKKSRQK